MDPENHLWLRPRLQLQGLLPPVLQIFRLKTLRRAVRRPLQVLHAFKPGQLDQPAPRDAPEPGGKHLRLVLRVMGLLAGCGVLRVDHY